jgi:hypothetical protein
MSRLEAAIRNADDLLVLLAPMAQNWASLLGLCISDVIFLSLK